MIKPKAGLQRKGHQVSQSANFKKIPKSSGGSNMLNKSYDLDSNVGGGIPP
jgi:hypothetical protein